LEGPQGAQKFHWGGPLPSPPLEPPMPLRGVNTPNFHTTPPASGGKEGESGRGGRRGEERKREGKGPPRIG